MIAIGEEATSCLLPTWQTHGLLKMVVKAVRAVPVPLQGDGCKNSEVESADDHRQAPSAREGMTAYVVP